jgi:ankyrin repeat protein
MPSLCTHVLYVVTAAAVVATDSSSRSANVERFLSALHQGWDGVPLALQICERGSLPVGTEVEVPISPVRGLSTTGAQKQSLHDFLTHRVHETAGYTNLLTCLIREGVIDTHALPGRGGHLLYVAAKMKDAFLFSLLLSRGAPIFYKHEPDGGASVLLAALRTRTLVHSLVRKAAAAEGGCAEWFKRLGLSAARATEWQPAAYERIVNASRALSATCVAMSSPKLSSAAARGASIADATTLVNSMASVVVQMLLAAANEKIAVFATRSQSIVSTIGAEGVIGVDATLTVSHDDRLLLQSSLAMLLSADSYGRTPLHAAAASGNADAIAMITEAALSWPNFLQDTQPPDSSTLAAALKQRDAHGRSPLRAACLAGHDEIAAQISNSMALAGMTPTTDADKSARKEKRSPPWLLRAVSSWAEVNRGIEWPRSELCAAEIDATVTANGEYELISCYKGVVMSACLDGS